MARIDQEFRSMKFIAPLSIGARWATPSPLLRSLHWSNAWTSSRVYIQRPWRTRRRAEDVAPRDQGGSAAHQADARARVDDRKQDVNVWMRTPSLRRRLTLSVGDMQTCFGFQMLDCRNGPSCKFSHLCAGCGGASPFNMCDCARQGRIK